MGNVGIKFVNSGSKTDLRQATQEELAFTTKYFTLKEKNITGFVTDVTVTGGAGPTVTFEHKLGYKPAYEIYFEDHDGRMFLIPGKSTDAEASCGIITAYDNSTITVQVGYYGGAGHAHSHVRKIYCIVFLNNGGN